MITVLGTFIGGLGLFLLAVAMITDGLKLAAGNALRTVLANSTSTRLRGVASGIMVTAVVQSSSAVTVATIGFVNAGLLTLTQSLGVIYGANIGTTMTGWIVAAVGFSFKIEVFALPLIGIGMLTRMLRPASRLGALGGALAGFGLFFIGVDLLKEAFEGASESFDVSSFAPQGGIGVMLYVLLGIAMTVVTQSSSAAIAITLTAATGGVLGINAAAAMVIGANVGTTSTAALSVIGATANARRVAAVHVIFNLLTGVVALLLLPVLMWVVRSTSSVLELQDIPAVSLALFHTVFNLLGVALMWPMTDPLARFLAVRFASRAERLARPQYLDQNVMATPVLAMEALYQELTRVGSLVRETAAAVISSEGGQTQEVSEREQSLSLLINEIEMFITNLEMARLADAQKGVLPLALRITGYYQEVIGLTRDLAAHKRDVEAIMRPTVADDLNAYQAAVLEHVEQCDLSQPEFSMGGLDDSYDALRKRWHDLKTILLTAAAARTVPVNPLNPALESLRGCLKIAEQLTKSAERLHALRLSGISESHPVEPAEAEPGADESAAADKAGEVA